MRYAQGGGLTAAQRAKREQVRRRAAELFARGYTDEQVAKELRVSRMSANRWRRAWTCGGGAALASRGPASLPRLSEAQFARLEAALLRGPAAHGWDDQCWTLSRIRRVSRPDVPPDLLPAGGVEAAQAARLVVSDTGAPGE